MRNERRGRKELEEQGYIVFPLYQPKMTAQGPIDAIAVGLGRVRFVQFRTNSWHDLKPTKQFANFVGTKSLVPTVEAWMFKDGTSEIKQRVLE